MRIKETFSESMAAYARMIKREKVKDPDRERKNREAIEKAKMLNKKDK